MHEDNEQTFKRRRTHSNAMIKDDEKQKSDDGREERQIVRMAQLKAELEADECDSNNNRDLTEGDVYTQLALRESDLALAKDVGQALLAENIELREKYESLLDVHVNQVEGLRQEKHEIQLKYNRVESLQEEKIHQLNNDLENLQNKLKNFETASKKDQRVRREDAYKLIDENAQLHSELTKVSASNKELLTEINRLQRMQRGKSCDDSFDLDRMEADALQQKLLILEKERDFLDTSMNELVADKEEFAKEVNLLTQKVISLTEELADSKSELSLCEEELNLSKKENIKLHEQLDEVKLQTSQHIALSGSSLFSEISMLEGEADFSMKLADSPSTKRLKRVASLQGIPKPLAASSSINLFKPQEEQSHLDRMSQSSLDDTSSDGGEEENGFILKQQGFFAELEEEQKANMELRKEMCAVCHQLLQACKLLTNNGYESKQTWEMNIDELFLKDDTTSGTLTMIAAEMIGLVKEYVENQENQDEEEREYLEEKLLYLEKQVEELTTECFEAKKQLSSLGMQLEQSRKEVNQKEEEICKLLEKINDQQSEIESIKNSSMVKSNSNFSGSQSVMEELEKARLDVQKLDTQLFTAINQKVQLSEQLEQWQYDMASMIEEQVQKQLKNTASERERTKKRTSRLPFMKKGWNWTS